MDKDSHIHLGYILGVFGIKGWLKVFSYCRPKEQILQYSNWQLYLAEHQQSHKLEQGKTHGNSVIAKLSGIDTRNDAQAMIQAEIWVQNTDLPKLPRGEYYWYQLVGMQVNNIAGEKFGVITSLIETGANDVLVVKKKNSKQEVLIPYVKDDVVKQVDLAQKLVMVDWHLDSE